MKKISNIGLAAIAAAVLATLAIIGKAPHVLELIPLLALTLIAIRKEIIHE